VRTVGIIAAAMMKSVLKKIIPTLLKMEAASSPICQYRNPTRMATTT